jgi:hypothetical protein
VKKVLKRIFVFKKENFISGWRKLHNEELQNIQSSLNTIRVVKLERLRFMRCIMHIKFVGKLEWRRPLGRHRPVWEDNDNVDIHKIGGDSIK